MPGERKHKVLIEAKEFKITRVDPKSLMIEQLVPKTDPRTKITTDRWVVYGYYGQLAHVAEALLRFSVKVPEGTLDTQIPALLKAIKKAEENIIQQIKEGVVDASTNH